MVNQIFLCFFCTSTVWLELKAELMGPKHFQSWEKNNKKNQSEHSISTSISVTDGASQSRPLPPWEGIHKNRKHNARPVQPLVLIWSPSCVECEIPSGSHVHSKHICGERDCRAVGGTAETLLVVLPEEWAQKIEKYLVHALQMGVLWGCQVGGGVEQWWVFLHHLTTGLS